MIPSARLADRASSDTRFQALFEQAPVSIQILAADGRTLRVNQAWEDLWQIRAGTALMAHVLSADYNVLIDPQLLAGGITPYLVRAFAGESVQIPAIGYDVAALGDSGPVRWVTARAHPIKDADGNLLEVMLMHEDITERIEAETALRIREERFRLLVMATSQIVWTNTPDGRVLEDSPSWRTFTGQTYEEWREFGWLDALHPDDRAGTIVLWTRCVATQTVFETRYRLRRADGQYRWVAVKGLPITDPHGGVREWIGANTDIHDRVMAETELAQRLEREKRNSALLAKVAQASHSLHTALSSKEIARALVEQVRDILQVHQAVVSLTEGDSWLQAINAVSLSDKYAHYQDYAASTDGTGIYAEVCRTNQVIRLTQAELTAHRHGRASAAMPPATRQCGAGWQRRWSTAWAAISA